MVGDIAILCSIILSGVQNTEKSFKKMESIQNVKKCYRILQKNINFRSWQWR